MTLSSLYGRLETLLAELKETEKLIDNLDLSEYNELEKKTEDLKDDISNLEKEIDELENKGG